MSPYENYQGNRIYRMFYTWIHCRNVCNTMILTCCVVLIMLTITQRECSTGVISIDVSKPARYITGPYFLSVAIDTSIIRDGLAKFNTSNEKLQNLVSHLAPVYFRIGGNMADRLTFSDESPSTLRTVSATVNDINNTSDNPCTKNLSNFTMTGSEWIELNNFAIKYNLKIIFDLNALKRNPDGSWNSSNAEQLISFSNKHSYSLDWELGNEPDAFPHLFNYSVNATRLANDFIILKHILSKYPRYQKSLLLGPSTTRPRPKHRGSAIYLQKFLRTAQRTVDVITWHQYYLNGQEATLEQFLDPATFELFEEQADIAKRIVSDLNLNDLPMWLGETSSAYGGGAPDLSDTFVGCFLWVDKLGVAALKGIHTVIRQSLVGGYYSLISPTYEPNPDWWLSIIYNQLVGNEVLYCETIVTNKLRFYCHCSNHTGHPSAVTVFGMNLQPAEAYVQIQGLTLLDLDGSPPRQIYKYTLTGESGLQSRFVLLNGKKMELATDGSLPVFEPEITDLKSQQVMLPYSITFFVIPDVNVSACRNKKFN